MRQEIYEGIATDKVMCKRLPPLRRYLCHISSKDILQIPFKKADGKDKRKISRCDVDTGKPLPLAKPIWPHSFMPDKVKFSHADNPLLSVEDY